MEMRMSESVETVENKTKMEPDGDGDDDNGKHKIVLLDK